MKRVQVIFAIFCLIFQSSILAAGDIHEAAASGDLDRVKSLIGSDSLNLNLKTSTFVTPLDYAVVRGNENIVVFLLKNGANPNVKTDEGKNSLFFALEGEISEEKSEKLVVLLASYGADVKLSDKKGVSVFHKASQSGYAEIMEFLISKGADINAKDEEGNTPLHYLARSFSEEKNNAAEILVKKGADVNAVNFEGMTALHFLARKSATNMASFATTLLKNGARTDLTDSSQMTPETIAKIAANAQFLEFLKTTASSPKPLSNEVLRPASTPSEIATQSGF